MSASDTAMQSALEDSLEENLANSVTEYSVRGRSVKRDPAMVREQLAALLTLRGLTSSRRGMNLAQIDRPA
jgi:hypothetical protein